jgi:hypothetical protein
MLVSRLAARAVLGAAFTLVAGCNSTTDASRPLEGTYLLESAAGQAVPALIHTAVDVSHPPIDIYVVNDTLQILAGGRYIQRGRLTAYMESNVVSTLRWSDHGMVTVDGNTLRFESEYLQNVSFGGTLAANGLIEISQNLANEGTVDLYRFSRAP